MNPNTPYFIFAAVVVVLLVAFALLFSELRRSFRTAAETQKEIIKEVFADHRAGFAAVAAERQEMLDEAREDARDLLDRFHDKHNLPPRGTDMQERHSKREARRDAALETSRANRPKIAPMTLAGAHKTLHDEAAKRDGQNETGTTAAS